MQLLQVISEYGHTVQLHVELSPVLKTSTSRSSTTPQDVTLSLPACHVPQQQYLNTRLSELPLTLRSLNVWLPCP